MHTPVHGAPYASQEVKNGDTLRTQHGKRILDGNRILDGVLISGLFSNFFGAQFLQTEKPLVSIDSRTNHERALNVGPDGYSAGRSASVNPEVMLSARCPLVLPVSGR